MDDDERRKVQEFLIQIQSGLFNAAAAYTNLVTIGGFAGGFAIWNFVRDFLSPQATAMIAILLGSSLAVFVAWNVHQMIWLALQRMNFSTKLNGLSGQSFIDKYIELEAEIQNSVFGSMMRWWLVMLVFTIISGYLAFLLLIWNCGAMLLGSQGWP